MLPNGQFGFRKGLGTFDALLSLTCPIQEILDHGGEARVVRLDFSSAFDRVNHKALLFKLKSYGNFFNIFEEFLTNRSQRVVVDGHCGELHPVLSSVPQGSVLGPLFFIIFTSDMWHGLENPMVAYADDATIYANCPCPALRSAVSDSLNRDLRTISK